MKSAASGGCESGSETVMPRAGAQFARANAIIGAIAWTIVVFVRTSPSAETNVINRILLLGILVIVPYFANRVTPIRLPINEVITVWAVDDADEQEKDAEQPTVKATHEMWICGIKFLKLAYDIFPARAGD
jgi:hypothetical protein